MFVSADEVPPLNRFARFCYVNGLNTAASCVISPTNKQDKDLPTLRFPARARHSSRSSTSFFFTSFVFQLTYLQSDTSSHGKVGERSNNSTHIWKTNLRHIDSWCTQCQAKSKTYKYSTCKCKYKLTKTPSGFYIKDLPL